MHFFTRIGTFLLLMAILTAVLYSVDPGDRSWGLEQVAFFKYLPVWFAGLASFFFLPRFQDFSTRGLFLLLISFFALLLFGSLVSLYMYRNVEETFLGRAVCAYIFLPSFLLCFYPREEALFAKWFSRIIVVGGFSIAFILVFWSFGLKFLSAQHIYHEEIFLVVAAMGCLLLTINKKINLLIFIFLGLATALSHKFTGYLCGAVSFLFLLRYFAYTMRVAPKIKKIIFNFSIAYTCAIVCASVAVLALFFADLLPTGSPSVRLFTYAERSKEFLENPFWGTFFVGSPIMDVAFLRIPSHSDILDVLAFGGLVGFLLLIVPVLKILHFHYKKFDNYCGRFDILAITSLFIVFSFGIEMMFNPVWGQPKLATIFWAAFGCLFQKFAVQWRNNEL